MNGVNSWKKTDELEIDLIDLLRRICMQWKQAAACALVFAVLLGGYGYLKNGRTVKEADSAETVEDLETEAERQAVNDAVQLAGEIEDLEEYMDNSILMQIDPYHKNRVIMLYSIDDANRLTLRKIAESYVHYLTNGGVIDELKKIDPETWDMDNSYLSELFSAWQSTDSTYQIIMDKPADDMAVQTILYVEVTGRDAGMAEQLAEDIHTALDNHYPDVKNVSGSHKLSLLDSGKSIKVDSSLQTQQHDKRTLITSNRTSLKTMTDAFSDAQKAVYQNIAGTEDTDEEAVEDGGSGISLKYILIGLAGGIFVYCCIYACFYMFRDTVKGQGEFKTYYNFPFYGCVPLKKGGGEMSGSQRDAYEREKAQMLNRVRLTCRKQKIEKLCLATDFSLNGQEKECLADASRQLREWGIETVLGENIGGNISMWDTLSEVGVVLMICKIGATTHRTIDEQMTFYLENEIDVLGAAALENV